MSGDVGALVADRLVVVEHAARVLNRRAGDQVARVTVNRNCRGRDEKIRRRLGRRLGVYSLMVLGVIANEVGAALRQAADAGITHVVVLDRVAGLEDVAWKSG